MNININEVRQKYADTLAWNAVTFEDYEEAVKALTSLKKVNESRAHSIALQILDERIGDVFYQALAFETLYAISKTNAVKYIEKNVGTESSYVFGAMLTAVAEDVGAIQGQSEILKAASLLRQELLSRSADDLQDLSEKIAWFKETYPPCN